MKALGCLIQYKTFKGKGDIELIINIPAHVALATQNLLGQIDPAEDKWVEISLYEKQEPAHDEPNSEG